MMKWVLVALAALLVLAGAALVALPWIINTPAFQGYVIQTAAQALGRPVRFASLTVSGLPVPTVNLRGLEVAEDPAFGPGPFLTVGEGRMRIRLRPLLSGRVELADLTLERPRIDLVEDARGRWNWASLGGAAPSSHPATGGRGSGRGATPAASAVLLSRVRIVDGSMQYRKVGGASAAAGLEKVNLVVSQALGGPVRLEGDALVRPGDVRIRIRDASLTPGGGRALGDTPLRATLEVDAADVAAAGRLLAASPAVSGALKGRIDLGGTALAPTATGAMTLDQLLVAEERPGCEPRRRQLALEELRLPIAYAGTSLRSVPVEVKVARGAVSFGLTVAIGPSPSATLQGIRVKGVDLGPILDGFLCQPYAVTGPLDLEGEASLRAADPWRTTSGKGRLRIGPGKVVGREVVGLVNDVVALAGAASALLAPERRARPAPPLDFDSITATYTITDGVVTTDDLLYQSRDIRIAGAGTYRLPDGRVEMAVTLTQGRNEVKGVVSGTAGALRVVPTSVRVPDSREIKRFLDRLFR